VVKRRQVIPTANTIKELSPGYHTVIKDRTALTIHTKITTVTTRLCVTSSRYRRCKWMAKNRSRLMRTTPKNDAKANKLITMKNNL